MLLHNKIAIITGAHQGIGKCTADLMLKEGATVISGDILARPEKPLGPAGQDRLYEGKLDIADPASIKQFLNAVMEQFGRVDIFVNNAAIMRDGVPFEDTTDEEWEVVTKVNMVGPALCARAVIPIMRAQKSGRIVSIGSIAGSWGGLKACPAYSMSKAGVHCMTKVLAKQLGPDGITVNAVAPGFVLTDMTRHFNVDLSSIPLRRRAEPEEVASAVLFLASDLASYITGVTLDVNGGVFIH